MSWRLSNRREEPAGSWVLVFVCVFEAGVRPVGESREFATGGTLLPSRILTAVGALDRGQVVLFEWWRWRIRPRKTWLLCS